MDDFLVMPTLHSGCANEDLTLVLPNREAYVRLPPATIIVFVIRKQCACRFPGSCICVEWEVTDILQ